MKVELVDLSRTLGRLRVLDGLDLTVDSGAAVAVSGPSGAGKTTLLRLVAGLDVPDGGRILLDGQLASRRGWAMPPHRRSIGFAFQHSALWPHMTVAANIAFGLHRLPGTERRVRVAEWLARMELDGLADRYPDQLSGGQGRRVALARALAPQPQLILFDEPLTNLEVELRERLLAVLVGHVARTAATVIYVTHDEREATRVAPRTLRLEHGRLTPADAVRAPATPAGEALAQGAAP